MSLYPKLILPFAAFPLTNDMLDTSSEVKICVSSRVRHSTYAHLCLHLRMSDSLFTSTICSRWTDGVYYLCHLLIKTDYLMVHFTLLAFLLVNNE